MQYNELVRKARSREKGGVIVEASRLDFVKKEKTGLVSLLNSQWSKIFFISKGNGKEMYAKIIGNSETKPSNDETNPLNEGTN